MGLEPFALYCYELDHVLEECKLSSFEEFVNKWHEHGLIDDRTYKAFINSTDQEKLNSYCSLIISSKKVSESAHEWAYENRKIEKPN